MEVFVCIQNRYILVLSLKIDFSVAYWLAFLTFIEEFLGLNPKVSSGFLNHFSLI